METSARSRARRSPQARTPIAEVILTTRQTTSIGLTRPASETTPSAPNRYDGRPRRPGGTGAPEVVEKLRPLAGSLFQEVRDEIQRQVPAYSGSIASRDSESVLGALSMVLRHCLDATGHHRPDDADWESVVRQAGKIEFAAGRPVDALQAAVRISGHAAWQWMSDNARSIGIPSETLLPVASSVFAWTDVLSAVATDGYHEAEAAAADVTALEALERSRRALTHALLSGGLADQERVGELAEAAAWPLPDRIVTIVVGRLDEQDALSDLRVRPDALVDLERTPPCVVLPDPARNRAVVSGILGGRPAAVGPAVPPAQVNRSLALAQRLFDLMRTDAVATTRVAWCQDHLGTLLVLADPFLTDQLHEHAKATFAGLTPKQRSRMATTLLAWLQSQGTANDLAAHLDVHPQTVRYRIHQLKDLLGDRLADPEARLTMELALRAYFLLNPQPEGDVPAHGWDHGAHQIPGRERPGAEPPGSSAPRAYAQAPPGEGHRGYGSQRVRSAPRRVVDLT